MTSTFAIQTIPPFKPKQQPAPPSLPPVLTNSHSSSTPPSASLPPNSASSDSWQPRRFSTTGVTGGTGHAYPSVFEIPNPQKSLNGGGTKGNDSHRGLSGVAEEDERRVNVKKRRASDEIEGERSETVSRRGSGEIVNDANDERRGSNESIRSSFSIPANPHPRPPPLVTRTSAPTVTSPPFRNSPSPNSTRDRQFHNPNPDRESPNSSSKRARTSMSTLESLAATATNLLSSSASSVSSSDSTPPTTASSSINHVLGPPSNAQTREHQTALETSRKMREQQQREIERRRIANGGTNQPTPGSVAAALGKLQGGGSSYRHSERGGSVEGAEGTGTGTGLAKRRGHRPPAVSTGSFPPSSSSSSSTNPLAINSSSRSSAYEEAMRSAPPGIPSVLVESPVEASWAARVGKEANVGSARGNASTSNLNSNSARRQSTSAMNAAYPSVREPIPSQPYPNPVVRTNGTSSRPGSYSHHHSASSQSMSTSHSKDRHPPPQQPSLTLNPPNSAPYAASHSHHPLSNNTRLPSLNQIVHSRPSPPSSSSQPPYHQHHHHHQHPPPPPLSPSPQSASKSAFLSLFSTFFDSLQDSRVLTNTLDQQISRAGSLLRTLQQSEECLERLVERKMAEAQVRWMEQVERKYEGRLERLENAVLTSSTKRVEGEEREGYVGLGIMDQTPTTTCFSAASSSTTTTTEDRLNKLERLLMASGDCGGGDGKAFEGGRENGNGEKSLPTPHEERENGVVHTSCSANGGVRGVVDGRDT